MRSITSCIGPAAVCSWRGEHLPRPLRIGDFGLKNFHKSFAVHLDLLCLLKGKMDRNAVSPHPVMYVCTIVILTL
jgi:hypothetical protein